ncbi:SIS domain-containing protein, partial [Microvirga sp. 2MCAF35]|uniref:SIS domain-containing protein n=1 Tax=Microvirga sp. 2MCAF35 TaxID=3232987 RepID=UPI003F984660
YLLEIQSGLVTASVGPSVTSVYDARPRMRDALFLAVSQSGRSPDILNLARAGRDDGALTVALVNDTASPLASTCEVVLPLHAGPETSVAATKSFIAALAAGLQLVAHWSQDRALLDALDTLPDVLAKAATDWSAALPALREADNLFVVGRGVGFAVAQEAALKLKETSGVHAEAMSAAELMHGPWTLAGEHFPILVLSQRDETLSGVSELVTRLTEQGVPVIVAGAAEGRARVTLPGIEDAHPTLAPIALIQSFYPLVNAIALARGRDPDQPPRLRKVTETV